MSVLTTNKIISASDNTTAIDWSLPELNEAGTTKIGNIFKSGIVDKKRSIKTIKEQESYIFEKAKEQGYKEGLEKSLREVTDRLEKEYQAKIKVVEDLYKSFSEESGKLENNMYDAMLNLSLYFAKSIINYELSISTEALSSILKRIMKEVVGFDSKTSIKINEEDYLALEKSADINFRAYENIIFTKDAEISKGGCYVETSITNIDATIESKIAKLFKDAMKNSSQVNV